MSALLIGSGASSAVEAGDSGGDNLTFNPHGGHKVVAFFFDFSARSGTGVLQVTLQHGYVPGAGRNIDVAQVSSLSAVSLVLIPMVAAFDGSDAGEKIAIPNITRVLLTETGATQSVTVTGSIYAIYGD